MQISASNLLIAGQQPAKAAACSRATCRAGRQARKDGAVRAAGISRTSRRPAKRLSRTGPVIRPAAAPPRRPPPYGQASAPGSAGSISRLKSGAAPGACALRLRLRRAGRRPRSVSSAAAAMVVSDLQESAPGPAAGRASSRCLSARSAAARPRAAPCGPPAVIATALARWSSSVRSREIRPSPACGAPFRPESNGRCRSFPPARSGLRLHGLPARTAR